MVLNAGRVREAEALLAGGMSGSAAARRLGIPVSTFNENRRAGVIGGGGGKTRGSSRSERDSRDREAPMGRATHDVAGRVLAMTGQMEEARPTFGEPAHGVAGGGVLAGLPMLLREGLLGAASRLLGLPNSTAWRAFCCLSPSWRWHGCAMRKACATRLRANGAFCSAWTAVRR